MKWIALLGTVFTILPCHPALADGLPQQASQAVSQRAQTMAPPKGKALVYFYQSADEPALSPVIYLNRASLGRLSPGSFTVWQVAAGQLNIGLAGPNPTLRLQSQAGQRYLFRVHVYDSNGQLATRLEPRPLSELTSSGRWLRNPKQVSRFENRNADRTQKNVTAKTPPAQSDTTLSAQGDLGESESSNMPATFPGSGLGMALRAGALSVSSTEQTIFAGSRTFDSSTSTPLSVEMYWAFSNGLSLGGEYLGYSARFTTTGMNDTHNVDVAGLLFNARLFFRVQQAFRPYIGAGLGVAVADVNGPLINGSSSGAAYQLIVGAEYRFSSVSMSAEYRNLSADTSGSSDEHVDVSANGIMAGLSFAF